MGSDMGIRRWLANVIGFVSDMHSLVAIHVNYVLNGGKSTVSQAIYFVAMVGGFLLWLGILGLGMYLWDIGPDWLKWVFLSLFWIVMLGGVHLSLREAHEEWRKTHPGPELSIGKRFLKWTKIWALCLLAAVVLVVSMVMLGVR